MCHGLELAGRAGIRVPERLGGTALRAGGYLARSIEEVVDGALQGRGRRGTKRWQPLEPLEPRQLLSISATSPGRFEVDLTWDAFDTTSYILDRYGPNGLECEYNIDGGDGKGNYNEFGYGTYTFMDTGLTPNTSYSYTLHEWWGDDHIQVTTQDVGSTLGDASFEDISVDNNYYGFLSEPYDGYWTFDGAGIAAVNDIFYPATGVDGYQFAMLRPNCAAMEQGVNLDAGFHTVSFLAAQSGSNDVNQSQTVRVRIDGNEVGTFTPTSSTFTSFTTVPIYLDGGDHTIRFETVASDGTAFIDNVSLSYLGVRNVSPLTISDQGNGSYVTSTMPTISGTVAHVLGDAVALKVYQGSSVNGTLVETWPLNANGAFTYDVPAGMLANGGTYTIQTVQTYGGTAIATSEPATFTIDVPPVISGLFITPLDNGDVISSAPTISGTAGHRSGVDSNTVTLQAYAGDTLFHEWPTTRAGNGAFSLTLPTGGLPEGTYTIRAMQSDTLGQFGYSDPSAICVKPVKISGSVTVGYGAKYQINVVSADPGILTVDWGDQTDPDSDGIVGEVIHCSGTLATASHQYFADPGIFTIHATASNTALGTYADETKVVTVTPLATWASESIVNLHNTGVNIDTDGQDTNWVIQTGNNRSKPAFVTVDSTGDNPAFPFGTLWDANSSTSKWISPLPYEMTNDGEGHFLFSTSFNLSNYLPSTASITTSFEVDARVDRIILNGQTVVANPLNLLTNGGLEKDTTTPLDQYHLVQMSTTNNNTAIPGWTVVSGKVDLVSDIYWQPFQGTYSVDMIGTPGTGAIQQVVSTIQGAHYTLTFDMAVNPENAHGNENGFTKYLRAEALAADGTVLASQNYSDTVGTRSKQNMQYVLRSLDFTANSATTTIRFSALAPTNLSDDIKTNLVCGPVLDNVKLTVEPSNAISRLMSFPKAVHSVRE